uniref:G-protein coupled receptors family 3 profile domain-containing protein n=1 Tax=Xenopus tropicalis TaxID=8364 RepID=A0A1B8YAH0_XENTR
MSSTPRMSFTTLIKGYTKDKSKAVDSDSSSSKNKSQVEASLKLSTSKEFEEAKSSLGTEAPDPKGTPLLEPLFSSSKPKQDLFPYRGGSKQPTHSRGEALDFVLFLCANSAMKRTPELLCNAPCAPGYRKSKREGAPSCCYDCVPCVDGEMSNTSDASSCFRCPGYEMSNEQRTACVPKMINYLSYEETLGASLASIALVLFLTTSAVQGVFVKNWDTPIVRANNQNLSCLLLISLMLCFLCTLLFIGHPTQICCLLRQVTFGIVFTISVSSVLAKTLTVIIAFNATKPGSKLKKCIGSQVPIVFVTICSLGEIGICLIWMTFDPPFLETDILSERDTIILQCNEGSVTFFFCIIGYIGTLALLSFIAAFLAKDFPDRFNEAKNITFSMLGFCSVWGAFVPAYLSSKGSRMVAVEIFAILSSSAGLLGCIFGPKCYIIFLRPQLNTKVIAQ